MNTIKIITKKVNVPSKFIKNISQRQPQSQYKEDLQNTVKKNTIHPSPKKVPN